MNTVKVNVKKKKYPFLLLQLLRRLHLLRLSILSYTRRLQLGRFSMQSPSRIETSPILRLTSPMKSRSPFMISYRLTTRISEQCRHLHQAGTRQTTLLFGQAFLHSSLSRTMLPLLRQRLLSQTTQGCSSCRSYSQK